jgi:hypothetical protein
MARCRCIEGTCGCFLRAGSGTTVTGDGSSAKPWVVSAVMVVTGTVEVDDTPSVDMTLAGGGTQFDPFHLTASAKLDPLINFVDTPSIRWTIEGSGTEADPFQVQAIGSTGFGVQFTDTSEVDFATSGSGTTADPIVVTATLPLLTLQGGNPGDVLTRDAQGVYYPGPPTQAPVGSVSIGAGLSGDGSGANPFRINLCTYDNLKAACAP